jgi:uncharacterized membrane protein
MLVRSVVVVVLASILCSPVLLGQSALPSADLTFKNIDLPGAQVTFSAGINNQGQIVGQFQDASGGLHGYLANEDGSLASVVDFPGATQTDAFGINEKGDIVGSYVDAGGATHGFLLTGEKFTSIDFPNAIFTSAEDINDRGDIAGVYFNSGFDIHGFMLDKSGFTTIDNPQQGSPASTQVVSINNRQEKVGVFFDAAGALHGFFEAHGVFTTIDAPGATLETVALGLSDSSATVGNFIGSDGFQHGYLLTRGTFSIVDFPSGLQNSPSQINASGSIVGIYADSAGAFHSFLAQRPPASPALAAETGAAAPLSPASAPQGHAGPGTACSAGSIHPAAPRGVLGCPQPE